MSLRIVALFALVMSLLPIESRAASSADVAEVRAKAERFWKAEVAQDYDAVYGMLSSDERSRVARDDYVQLRKTTGPMTFLAATVGDTDSAADLVWVNVKFDWISPKFGGSGRPGETWQLWRRQDGWQPVPAGERDQWPILPPKLRPAADEARLTERVAGLWKAKEAADWKAVYDYMPPYFRAGVSLDQFLKSKAAYLYSSATVRWVEVKGTEGRAGVAFDFKPNDAAVSKMKPQSQMIIEPWAKIDGNWYIDLSVLEQQPPPSSASPR